MGCCCRLCVGEVIVRLEKGAPQLADLELAFCHGCGGEVVGGAMAKGGAMVKGGEVVGGELVGGEVVGGEVKKERSCGVWRVARGLS